MKTIDLYDLLDLAPGASEAEIRVAWKSAIADLDPGDRRFRAYNQAAETLLDVEARRAYDQTRTPEVEAEPEVARAEARSPEPPTDQAQPDPDRAEPRSAWPLALLTLLTVMALAASAWLWTSVPTAQEREADVRTAVAAAESAIVPVLSYDHLDLDASQQAAEEVLTSSYAKEYAKFFQVIRDNAPSTKATVTAKVIASGVVRTGDDRVEVLLFVDRPTTNKAQRKPVVYRDQVTVTMVRSGDSWLVDGLKTSPAQN